MTQPVGGDLHVDRVLTNFSVAWVQSTNDFISSKVFPRLPVDKRTDRYKVYNRGQMRTDAGVFKRAPGTESRGIGWNFTHDTYYVDPFAVHVDLDDQTLAEADDPVRLPKEATELITQRLLLSKELDWHRQFFVPGVWANEPVPDALWDDVASDPIAQVGKWVDDFTLKNSKAPNTMIVGTDVWRALKNHPDLVDRIKYTQRGLVTADLIGAAFEIPTILVSRSSVVPNFEERGSAAADNANAAAFSYITNPKAVLLTYSTPSPRQMEPIGGLSITWKGYFAGNAQGVRIKRFRMENIESDRIEGMITYQHKLVAPNMGLYVNALVA
jgi:Phage major capsid protein E